MKKYVGKVTAIAMVAATMVSMTGVTAFAADTKETNVKYEVTEGYEWSVPSEIDFTTNPTVTTSGTTGATQDVYVSKNVIANGKKLSISLNNPTFKITSAEGAELKYAVALKDGDALSADKLTVLEVNAGTNTATQSLTFTLTKDTVEKAGSYTGTLPFVASIVTQ